MGTFFTIASILLHMISLYCISLLFIRISNLKKMKQEQESIYEETSELLAGFMLEQREEHERFLRALSDKPSPRPDSEANTAPAVSFEKPDEQHQQEEKGILAEGVPEHLRFAEGMQDTVDLSAQRQEMDVNALSENGHSIEEIARMTGKGKTEVELILKFRQKQQ
ncbi:hypothetical protein GKZ89_05050 [Bacillus mangrovi]|uniref:Swarming motility protein SwrB n=1 Tax=Metabacillus mangrovi TaxID=1491830 RepID=A0A7X2V449_9BACI|nr:hypothetical protein [Metabacillus mangrovi]MTH52769.1 hypothetical protein [Metabacillus mangrovi]